MLQPAARVGAGNLGCRWPQHDLALAWLLGLCAAGVKGRRSLSLHLLSLLHAVSFPLISHQHYLVCIHAPAPTHTGHSSYCTISSWPSAIYASLLHSIPLAGRHLHSMTGLRLRCHTVRASIEPTCESLSPTCIPQMPIHPTSLHNLTNNVHTFNVFSKEASSKSSELCGMKSCH